MLVPSADGLGLAGGSKGIGVSSGVPRCSRGKLLWVIELNYKKSFKGKKKTCIRGNCSVVSADCSSLRPKLEIREMTAGPATPPFFSLRVLGKIKGDPVDPQPSATPENRLTSAVCCLGIVCGDCGCALRP